MLSNSVNPRYLSLQDRCRQGSLPLKKRRVNLEFSLFSSGNSNQSSFNNIEDRTRLAYLSEQTMVKESSVKMTPLTLLAAAESLDRSQPEDEEEYNLDDSRLDQPLPGGCHGKTSRTNSYCRRHPCFNGSKYCKLHYQQFVKSQNKTPVKAACGASGGAHQDKRYTGQPHEVRCLATTTRGRDCGYIAVNSSKYCYLHADYDTNPPPRRGGGGGGGVNCKSDDTVSVSPSVASDESSSSSSSTTTTVSTTAPAPQAGNSKRRTSAKLKQMHAASPFPLLSMISTDQWYKKTVKIATGPFAGRFGDVEKWGNGWVSVNIPGVGLHNRRSFELYLKDEEKQEDEVPNNLFRCVSHDARDVVSPSPSSDNSSSTKSRRTPSLKTSGSDIEGGVHLMSPVPGTPRPATFETPVTSNSSCNAPEVTPFTVTSVRSITLQPKEPTTEMLQLPDVGQAMPFAPSMGEKTRGRATTGHEPPLEYKAGGLLHKKRSRAMYEGFA